MNNPKNIMILFFSMVLLTTFGKSCAMFSQDRIDKRFQSKIADNDFENDINLNKLYISDGYYECKKDWKILNRLQSTSDGIYDDFLFITNNGKMYFTTLPSSNTPSKDLLKYNSLPNAIFYLKNGKYIIERKSVTHAILGIGGGEIISRGALRFINEKIYIKNNSTNDHCSVYSQFKNYSIK